ncbi:hypothetical protein D3C84_942320 [compost metagenome]
MHGRLCNPVHIDKLHIRVRRMEFPQLQRLQRFPAEDNLAHLQLWLAFPDRFLRQVIERCRRLIHNCDSLLDEQL